MDALDGWYSTMVVICLSGIVGYIYIYISVRICMYQLMDTEREDWCLEK